VTASFQIVPGMNAVTIPAEAQKRMEGVEQGVTFMQYFFYIFLVLLRNEDNQSISVIHAHLDSGRVDAWVMCGVVRKYA